MVQVYEMLLPSSIKLSGACTAMLVCVLSDKCNSAAASNVHFPTTLNFIVTFVNGAVVKLNVYLYDLPSSTAPSFGTFNERCSGCTIMDTSANVTLYFLSSLIQTTRAVVEVAPFCARNAIFLFTFFDIILIFNRSLCYGQCRHREIERATHSLKGFYY